MSDHTIMGRRNWADLPIAVVGMACRLPGADDLGGYWKLVSERGCARGRSRDRVSTPSCTLIRTAM